MKLTINFLISTLCGFAVSGLVITLCRLYGLSEFLVGSFSANCCLLTLQACANYLKAKP